MKIVDIRTIPLSYRCDPPYGSAGGMQARRGGLLVEIETDERVIGIGEAGVGGGATAGGHRKAVAADADRRGPAADRGAVAEDVRAHPPVRPPRHRHERDQRHRHRAVGHRRQGRQIAALSPARRLPRPGRGLCQRRLLPGRQIGRRSRRRGRGLPRPRLQGHEDEDRAQPVDPDPSAPSGRTMPSCARSSPKRTSRGSRRCAARSARRRN